MITQDRLHELIEQSATIYEAKYNNINPVRLDAVKDVSYKYGIIVLEPSPTEKYKHHKYIKNLFETFEEAEEWLEFGKVKKVIEFPYITYDQFKTGEHNFSFYAHPYSFYCYKVCGYVEIRQYYDLSDRVVFSKKLTRETYNEARRICKKLFLGEIDDRHLI